MIISVFYDGAREHKIADFYDKDYACALLKGCLLDAENLEKETLLVFAVRQPTQAVRYTPGNNLTTDFLNNTERGDL